MTLDEFLTKYDGKEVDWDAQFGNQCKDLFSAYNTEVVGCPFYVFGNANELWDNAPPEYYTQTQTPQKGDVVIWGTGIGAYGHVAIFNSYSGSGFISFDQNFPIGSPCHYQYHNYSHVIGYLRPKGVNMGTGFSDANMQSIVEKTLRKQRTISFGKVDEAGLSADIKSAMDKIKTGNVDVLADILTNYSKANDNIWMKKKDCKECPPCPEVVCPDCSTLIKESKDNWQMYIEMKDKVDDLTKKLADCQRWAGTTPQMTWWEKVRWVLFGR